MFLGAVKSAPATPDRNRWQTPPGGLRRSSLPKAGWSRATSCEPRPDYPSRRHPSPAPTDHTGALELVTDRYPDVPVYATAPTIALIRVLHQDARRIMQSRLDEEGELPLFDDVSVQRLMAALVPVPFLSRVPLGEGVSVTFFPAGHIAGAAMLGLESSEGNLLITGDFSISPQRTVDGARPPLFTPMCWWLKHLWRAVACQPACAGTKIDRDCGCRYWGRWQGADSALPQAGSRNPVDLGEGQRNGELPLVPVWSRWNGRTICHAYWFADVLPLSLQERGAGAEGHPAVQTTAECPDLAAGRRDRCQQWDAGRDQRACQSICRPRSLILVTGCRMESPGRRLQELAEKGWYLAPGKRKVDVQCLLGIFPFRPCRRRPGGQPD